MLLPDAFFGAPTDQFGWSSRLPDELTCLSTLTGVAGTVWLGSQLAQRSPISPNVGWGRTIRILSDATR
jgi:hypothetical protein